MSRFFGGGGKKPPSSGSGGRNAGLLSGIKSESLQKAMKYAKKSGGAEDDRYQQLVKENFESNKQTFMMGGRTGANKISTPKDTDKTPSKATMATLEKLAMKMAKQQMRKEKKRQPVDIKTGYIGGMAGGYIDKKGRVFNNHNQQVLQIDLKSGKIKTIGLFGGSSIGKYDPNSSFCLHKISKKIEEFNIKKGHGAATGSIWGTKDASSIYGTPPNNNGGGWDGNGW